MRYSHLSLIMATLIISGCSSTGDNRDTLGSLNERTVTINKDASVSTDVNTAIQTYEEIIQNSSNDSVSERALRRLGDLEMQRIEKLESSQPGSNRQSISYDKAIETYQTLLIRYPDYSDRETVIYQLARAYEHSGQLDKTIKALQILARDYPDSEQAQEINFRLGEILFLETRYNEAEIAYNRIINNNQPNNKYYEQALFKHAWTIYKQDRCNDSLDPFFSVLDLKLARNLMPSEIEKMDYISSADSELVDDSMRAITTCFSMGNTLANLQQYLRNKPNRVYEFLIYRKLAELNLRLARKDQAAEMYSAFFNRSEWHPYGVIYFDKSIDIYTNIHEKEDIIAAKKEFVRRFDVLSEYLDKSNHNDYQGFLIKNDSVSLSKIRSRLKVHLLDIAKYHHARAQKTDNLLDFQEAAKWYRLYLQHFPQSEDATEIHFLLAETLFEDKLYDESAREFEQVAYEYGMHSQAAEAGYAALIAYSEQDRLLTGPDKKAWHQTALQSALTFAKKFPRDPRTPSVLAKAAHELYEGRHYNDAVMAAETILHRYPDSDRKIRRTALIILANTQFELSNYEVAELFYTELRSLMDRDDPLQTEIKERLAACIYKQAENFRIHGAISSAIDEFKRIIETVPDSSVRPIAEFDIAATYIIMDRWQEAAKHLEAFKQHYPDHPLNIEVEEKLAITYMHLEDPLKAAEALSDIVKSTDSPESRREILWHAAELFEKANENSKAAMTYSTYANMFPSPLERAIEALNNASIIYLAIGSRYNYRIQLEKIYDADINGGTERTNRTRFLAAQAAFVLAEPHYERYAKVRLIEPIRKNMELKNQLMKQALKAYNKAADMGVAEYTTAATYRIADMYADFSHKLLDSDRPRNLDGEEMEQYELMLEEQAFPFEEQAIALHENNVNLMRENSFYNDWVQNSINALAILMPARYLRTETHAIAAETTH